MIIIYTRAYNAEVTLRRTIESILNQTFTDFKYILFDNGSQDSTFDIMKEYAKRDDRIIILRGGINRKSFVSVSPILHFIVNNYDSNDYICNIDADDVYRVDFFEKMYSFVQLNQLEVAFCGYNLLDRDTGTLIECKRLNDDLVIENEDLPEYFMTYRRYTTDMWAKLFKVSSLEYYLDEDRFEFLKERHPAHQNFIYDALQNSARIGILSEPLMDYYVSNISQKNTRIGESISLIQSRDIFLIMQNFLSKFKVDEKLSRRNIDYMYAIYCGYIKDLIEVIKLNNAISFLNKINHFFDIFSHHITKEMLSIHASEEFYSLSRESKEELCNGVVSYIAEQKNTEGFKLKIEKLVTCMRNCGICIYSNII